jgi:hypothetical protein
MWWRRRAGWRLQADASFCALFSKSASCSFLKKRTKKLSQTKRLLGCPGSLF